MTEWAPEQANAGLPNTSCALRIQLVARPTHFSYFHFAVLPGFRSVWALPIRPGKVRM